MTAKWYLEQVARLDGRLKVKQDLLTEYRELAASVSGVNYGECVKQSKNYEPSFLKYYEKIDQLEREIADMEDEMADLKFDIEQKISKIEDANEQMVLIYRYLFLMEWKQIVQKMHFSESWLYKVHKSALESLAKELKNLRKTR